MDQRLCDSACPNDKRQDHWPVQTTSLVSRTWDLGIWGQGSAPQSAAAPRSHSDGLNAEQERRRTP
eukprot:6654269-Pyramimonas_sp.AAC.1